MYELDCKEEGFTWVNADDNTRSIFSFERHSEDGKDHLLFVCNFTPVAYTDYRVGAYKDTEYELILNSDDQKYSGSGMNMEKSIYQAEKISADRHEYSFAYPLPAYGAAVFKFQKPIEKKKKKQEKKIDKKKESGKDEAICIRD